MATHSSTLAWKILWTEKPDRLQTMGSQSRTRLSDITHHKETKDLYVENYKILVKGTKDDTGKWRDIPCSWIGRMNIMKIIANTTQSNLQIQCNPYQTTNDIFYRIRTKIFTICTATQKSLNSQSNLEKEEWSWRNQLT